VIVTDPLTSSGMGAFIEARGGTHDRFKLGYRSVIDRAAATAPEQALLAIETSGHSAWRDNAFVDDGCYTAARLLGRLARFRRETGRPRGGVLEILGQGPPAPKSTLKVRVPVASLGAVAAAGARLEAALAACAAAEPGWEVETVNHFGLRCSVGVDWVLVRASLHEPNLYVHAESGKAEGAQKLVATLLAYLGDLGETADLSALRAAAVPRGHAPHGAHA